MFVRRFALPILGSALLVTACTSAPIAATNPTATAHMAASSAPTAVAPTVRPSTTFVPPASPTTVATAVRPSPITMVVNQQSSYQQPGTYFAGDPYEVPLTFSLPIGWETNMGGPFAVYMDRNEGRLNLAMVILGMVSADPCHVEKGFLNNRAVGPTAEDLAAALTKMPNATASAVEGVTVGGYPAKTMSLSAPADLSGCTTVDEDGDQWSAWQLPLGAVNVLSAGQSQRLWIVDAPNGQRLTIYSDGYDALRPAELAEVQGIINSIVFQH
jgi:hypothetical protein